MSDDLQWRWLGVAGLEIRTSNGRLLIDPFFTRPLFWKLLFGRVKSQTELTARYVESADGVLVTHAHYDHLLDVPDVMRLTQAAAYGSRNMGELLALSGIPSTQIHTVQAGDVLQLKSFRIEVVPGRHVRTPIDGWINGPLRRGIRPPFRLLDYRMDTCFAYRITCGEVRILVGNHPIPADIWFTPSYLEPVEFQKFLSVIQPKVIVPIHWDDFFRPLEKGIVPVFQLPRLAWPPLRRQNPSALARLALGVEVHLPRVMIWVTV